MSTTCRTRLVDLGVRVAGRARPDGTTAGAGDAVMPQILAAVPAHGLEAVLVAAEMAHEAGRPSAEHVLNVLARLKDGVAALEPIEASAPTLRQETRADMQRFDSLREVHT